MKAGWKQASLGELCRIELGSTPARKSPKLWDDKRLTENVWLSIADLPVSLHANAVDSKEYVSDLAARDMKVVPKGTLLVSFKLTLGRLAYAGRDLFTNEAIAALHDVNQSRIHLPFLYWALIAFDWDKAAEGDHKVKGKTLNKEKLKVIPIPLPPLEEQQRIVAILDEAFEGLDRAKANAEANLASAKELFEALKSAALKEAQSIGTPVRLDDVIEINSSLVDPREDAYADLPHLGAGNMVTGSDELVDVKTAREEKLVSGKYVFDQNTVLYSKIRPYLRKAARPNFEGLCSADVYPLTPDRTKLDRGFLFHLLLANDFTQYAIRGSDRAGMPKVNRRHLFAYEFSLPSLDAQRRAAAEIDEANFTFGTLASCARRGLDDLDELRQSLLAKAFAGELT